MSDNNNNDGHEVLVSCPSCNKTSYSSLKTWDDFPVIPLYCPYCEEFSWIKKNIDQETLKIINYLSTNKSDPPDLKEKTEVYINNKDHEFYLERGIVVGRDHVYYRVLFSSLNERINGYKMWVPEHWVKEIPEDLK